MVGGRGLAAAIVAGTSSRADESFEAGGGYGGAEITSAKAFAAGLDAVFIDGSSAKQFPPGRRLWGGYENCDRLAWRVNWWQRDQYSSGTSPEILCGEFTKTALRSRSRSSTSLRRRWCRFFGVHSHVGGWCLTNRLLAYHDIPGMPGLKLVVRVQWRVYGNTVSTGIGDASGENVALEGTMPNILELQIGPQDWTWLGQSPIFDGLDGSDIGLVGCTVNTGIRRRTA